MFSGVMPEPTSVGMATATDSAYFAGVGGAARGSTGDNHSIRLEKLSGLGGFDDVDIRGNGVG